MRTKCLAFALITWTLALTACDEPQAWQNGRRYAKTSSTIFISNSDAELDISGAWRPSAVWLESPESLVFADRGTRQINRFNTATRKLERLADLAVHEQVLNAELAFNQTWGEQLQGLGAGVLAVLGPRRAMAMVDLSSGDVSIVGKIGGLAASEGLRLDEVDFSDFSGFGSDPKFVYLSFATELFRLARTGQGGVDFAQSQLEHLAGVKYSAPAQAFQKAKDASLHLDPWTRYVSDKGLLYFWEPPHFRAIKDGMLISLGGSGFQSPAGSDMQEFNARHLPQNAALALKDGKFYSPYWRFGQNLIEMEISQISSVDGSSQGYVEELPMSTSGISDFTVMGDTVFSVTQAAGNFWMTPLETLESSLLFGPMSEQARFDSLSEGSQDYDVQASIAPQSLIGMLGGNLLLSYAPSLGRLSGLSSKYAKYVQTIWTAKSEIVLEHLLSDGQNWAWFSSGSDLYAMHIDDQNEIKFSYNSQFFSAPSPTGSPADPSQIKLTESPRISAYQSGFLLHLKASESIIAWNLINAYVFDMADPSVTWARLSKTTTSFERQALMLTDIKHFSSFDERQVFVQDNNKGIFIGLANTGAKQTAYGKVLPSNMITLIAGQGERALDGGLMASEIYFSELSAISFDPTNLAILMAADGALWQLDEAGLMTKIALHCGELPEASPSAFVRLYGEQTEALAMLGQSGQVYVCSQTQTFLGDTALTQAWTKIDDKSIGISTCGLESSHLGILKQDVVCGLELGAKPSKAICTNAEKGWRFEHFGCRFDKSLVSATSTDDSAEAKEAKFAVYEVKLGKRAQSKYAMGLGLGLHDEGPITQTDIGYEIKKMVVDGIPAIYFWMRDTCSIWRLVPDPKLGIQEDSIVTRHITHPKLCSASAMAVRFDSSIAIVDDDKLWQWQGNEFKHLADMPAKTLDMLGMGQAFVILTRAGIYTYEAGSLIKNAPNPILIDGERIDYGIGGNVLPKMLQVVGENAIYLPVFEKNRILKIAL